MTTPQDLDERFRAELAGLVATTVAKDLDEPVRDDTALTGAQARTLYDAQCISRHLDLAARWLRGFNAGYYTIGSSGHEGNASVAAALRPTDPALLHYRSGGFYSMRAAQVPGSDPIRDVLRGLVASVKEPIAGGRHKVFGHPDLHIIPTTSTIASHLPRAVGLAYALGRGNRTRPAYAGDGTRPADTGNGHGWPADAITVCSFGDASINHASATAAFNTAGWCDHVKLPLPLLFVCEDNGIGISVRSPDGWVSAALRSRPGLRYYTADGCDSAATYDRAAEAAAWVRRYRRPAVLHLTTVRLMGHAGADAEMAYRSPVEMAGDLGRDPLVRTARLLVDAGMAAPAELMARYDELGWEVRRVAEEVLGEPKLASASEVTAPLAPRRPVRVSRAVGDAALFLLNDPEPAAGGPPDVTASDPTGRVVIDRRRRAELAPHAPTGSTADPYDPRRTDTPEAGADSRRRADPRQSSTHGPLRTGAREASTHHPLHTDAAHDPLRADAREATHDPLRAGTPDASTHDPLRASTHDPLRAGGREPGGREAGGRNPIRADALEAGDDAAELSPTEAGADDVAGSGEGASRDGKGTSAAAEDGPTRTGEGTSRNDQGTSATRTDRTDADRTGDGTSRNDQGTSATRTDRTGAYRTGEGASRTDEETSTTRADGPARTGADSTGDGTSRNDQGTSATRTDRTGAYRTGDGASRTDEETSTSPAYGPARTGADGTGVDRTGVDRTGVDSTGVDSTGEGTSATRADGSDWTGAGTNGAYRTDLETEGGADVAGTAAGRGAADGGTPEIETEPEWPEPEPADPQEHGDREAPEPARPNGNGRPPTRAGAFNGRLPELAGPLTLAQTINAALTDAMLAHPQMVVFGEDVAVKGGVYGVTKGLRDRFGTTRVFDTLLDETSILGLGLGAGLAGMLPVPEIQYLAYLHNAEDQLRGEAATMQFFSQGAYRNPMVVRVAGLSYQLGFGGHFHNDNAVAVLRDIPGLVLAVPARAEDAAPMLRTCLASAVVDGSVCVFLEPIALYHTRDLHAEGDNEWLADYTPPAQWGSAHVPIGRAKAYLNGAGDDLTIITFGNGVRMSLRASARLAEEGISCRVLDLRWLSPLPVGDIIKHASDTGRVLVVDETRRSGGVGEGVIAALVDAGYVGVARRVAAVDTFVPLGPAANHVLVSADQIVQGARSLLAR